MELNAVFTGLVSRFPTMRLAVDVDELRMRRDVLVGGLAELPVRW
jgi:pentalenolactone synthase